MSFYEIIKQGVFGDVDTACLEKVAKLIASGEFLKAWKDDTDEMVACTVTAFATLLLAAGGWLHRRADRGDAVGPVFKSKSAEDSAHNAIMSLAESLEMNEVNQVYAGPVTEAFYAMVLQAFLAYLQNKLPELVEMLRRLAEDANG